MNFVTRGIEKVAVSSIADAKVLMRTLSDLDCKEPLSRQEVIGKEGCFGFLTCFGEEKIATGTQDDAERIASWLLSLGAEEVTIKRSEGNA